MVRTKKDDTTTNGFVQTTDTSLSENIVVNVSIPRSIAEGHEVQLSIITRANSQVDVQTKCIPQPESTVRVPVTPVFTPVNAVHPDISRLNLSDEVNSPIRRDGTVAFNPPSPRKGGPATPRTPITPASARQTARWADAVDVSDDEADGDNYPVVAVYPPPYGELETPHLEQYDGRKYYVITKGRKIGVFYSTWNAIAPYCMKHQGGEFSYQPSYTAAKNCWNATPRADRRIIGN